MPRRLKCSAILFSGAARLPGPLGLRAVERVQHHVEVLRRRRHVRDDVVVEGDDADAVALALREVGEAGADEASRIPASRCRWLANPIDREMSNSTEKLVLVSASYCLT